MGTGQTRKEPPQIQSLPRRAAPGGRPTGHRPELIAAGYKFASWGRTGTGFNRGITGPMVEYWVHPVTLDVVAVPAHFQRFRSGIMDVWRASGWRLVRQQWRWWVYIGGPRRWRITVTRRA